MQGNTLEKIGDAPRRLLIGALAAALVATAALATPARVFARAATLVSVTGTPGENHPTSSWCLPDAVQSELIETATSDEVGVGGHFLQKNLKTFNIVDAAATSFTDEFEFEPGRYYVHVGTHDRRGTYPDTPLVEFSNVVPFDIVDGPNVVGTTGACPVLPGGGGGGGGGGGVVTDKVAPVTSLTYRRAQRVGKLYVKVHTSETATIRATGVVRIGKASKAYRLKTVSLSLPGNASTKVRLRLAKKSHGPVKRALKRHRRLKARITIAATDAAGNRRSKSVVVRLKR
jgi:hypothetical protein